MCDVVRSPRHAGRSSVKCILAMERAATPSSLPQSPSAHQLLRQDSERLMAYFKQILGRIPDAPPRLIESIDYSLTAGGKRLRPVLVMECYRACAGHNTTARSEASAL